MGRWIPSLGLAFALAGCATPVGVERVPARDVHRELTANVLSAARLSADTLQVLTGQGLRARWEDDPVAALEALHARLGPSGNEDLVFALAELSFSHAEHGGGRPWYVAAAVYAWAFLFPGDAATPPSPADRRTRVAFGLYNRGLIEGLPEGAIEEVPRRRRLEIPFGVLSFETDMEDFVWAGRRLRALVPSADFDVRGVANRYRRSGIGAPMTGSLEPIPEGQEPAVADLWISDRLRVPVTLVLELEDARRGLVVGELRGRLQGHYWIDSRTIEIHGRRLPLEVEVTAALAHALADAPIWDFELRGFFSGSYRLSEGEAPDRLQMLHSWLPGRVPVVLVHGTASSPGRWVDLVNELMNDPDLVGRIQIWLFLYNTGNPIAYSAGLLREALADVVERLDPEGVDRELRRMVVVGHSQGGLLTRLQATGAGTSLWDRLFEAPPEELSLDDDARQILERSLLFEPAPWVGRVVYVSTPHGGSYLAGFRLARLLSSLLRLPANLVGLGVDLFTLDRVGLRVRRMDRLPTSIDNMTPGHPFMEWLRETPPVDSIPSHSIIPVKGGPPPEGQSDGVVRYESAHLESAASEKLIFHASHSVQGHPDAILELKRILVEHLATSREVPDDADPLRAGTTVDEVGAP